MSAGAPVRRGESRALLLRRFPYGESSLVVHALTPGRGRLALLAKGAYRPTSGFFGALDLFDTLEIRWTSRGGQELGNVNAVSVVTRRRAITGDLERYRVSVAWLELANLAAREGHEETGLYRWLEGGLELLEHGASPGVVAVAQDLAFLHQVGLAPALTTCASCGERPAERRSARFSLASGGRLCERCERARRGSGTVEDLPLNVVKVAESLLAATPAVLQHTRIEPGLLARVRVFVERFLHYHLELPLRARRARSPSLTSR